jgi:hypothetical protein
MLFIGIVPETKIVALYWYCSAKIALFLLLALFRNINHCASGHFFEL